LAVPAARESADAVRRLLPRADGGHPDPRAGADAGDPAARYRSCSLRPRHGAEPDDRPSASADGDGAVRACARVGAVGREDDDRDHSVARAAVALPDTDHVHPADLAVAAAAHVRIAAVAAIRTVEILQVDLPPKVRRTDAIQAFVTQETPIVRITCD